RPEPLEIPASGDAPSRAVRQAVRPDALVLPLAGAAAVPRGESAADHRHLGHGAAALRAALRHPPRGPTRRPHRHRPAPLGRTGPAAPPRRVARLLGTAA